MFQMETEDTGGETMRPKGKRWDGGKRSKSRSGKFMGGGTTYNLLSSWHLPIKKDVLPLIIQDRHEP